MLTLPCCRRGGKEGWDGEGTEGVSATGSKELPLAMRQIFDGHTSVTYFGGVDPPNI